MKVKLTGDKLELLFTSLQEQGYDTTKIASVLKLNRRTIADWKRGKYNIELSSFIKLTEIAGIKINKIDYEIIDVIQRKREIASIGGVARWNKYGFIGTHADRVKGGQASYISRRNKIDIFSRKKIITPSKSTKLAEFIGICMGDGSISDYQLTISLNDKDDKEYIQFVSKIINELFGLNCKLQKRPRTKCTNVVVSSIELVEYLIRRGLPKGDKVRAGLNIPKWILCDRDYSIACIRGLFDTDGSIYLENHCINNKVYSYPRMSFVSASVALRDSVFNIYSDLEIHSNARMNRSINIERFTDIEKYFKIVGSNNDKHLRRFAQFGGVG